MKLQDPRKLHRLMVIQGVSRRELARAAGWSSHGLLNRLLDPGDPSLSVTPERACKIAAYLQVAPEDLFTAESSLNNERHSRNGAPQS